MKESKKRGGLAQGALAFLALYAAITLLPAAAYGLMQPKKGGAPAEGPESSTAASSQEEENASSGPSSPESSQAPGFLDGLPLPGGSPLPSAAPAEGDVFTLYDQASEQTFTLSAEELLPAAIACEMDLSSPEEALKAQAVACYTLFCRKRAEGEPIVCDPQAWQTWTDPESLKERWGEDYGQNMELLGRVVESVSGQALTQEGKPILAAYFAISSGATETAGNVWEGDLPYLQAVASPGDALADGYLSSASFTFEEFREAAASYFGDDCPELSGDPKDWLSHLEYTPSGYVKSGSLGGKTVSGTDLRAAFSLRSACFRVEHQEDGFHFTVRGWGHGVGMSQAGAVFLAKRGSDYREILARYYPGAQLISP